MKVLDDSPSLAAHQDATRPKREAKAAREALVDSMRPISEMGNPPFSLAEAEQQVDKMRDKFEYDPKTGLLYYRWINNEDIRLATKRVGLTGYGRVAFYGLWTTSANVVWLLHKGRWPNGKLKRLNDNPMDDRIENLFEPRAAVEYALLHGMKRERKNKSRGVARCGPHHWQAYCKIDGRQVNLGRYNTEAEALAARHKWETEDRVDDLV